MSLEKKGADMLSAVRSRMDIAKSKPSLPRSTEPSTAIGLMVTEANNSLRERLERAEAEAASNQVELEKLKKLKHLHYLDPHSVRASPFCDRHPMAFNDKAFVEFCDLVKETGGNTEPGQVRPLEPFDPENPVYEIASGHRRHAACLKLGLPFLAIVREMDDSALIQQMYSENTGRENLSAFERGRHYALLLKQKKYASQRELAAKRGLHQPTLVELLKYDDLADSIIAAFPDPREIRQYWVNPLVDAWKKDAKRVAAVSTELQAGGLLRPMEIYRRLAGIEQPKKLISTGDQVLGRIRQINGCPAVVLFKEAPTELVEEISALVLRWAKDKAR